MILKHKLIHANHVHHRAHIVFVEALSSGQCQGYGGHRPYAQRNQNPGGVTPRGGIPCGRFSLVRTLVELLVCEPYMSTVACVVWCHWMWQGCDTSLAVVSVTSHQSIYTMHAHRGH